MAPYNLSDFAVKELKIPGSALVPEQTESYLGKFLFALFLDFWALFWMNALFTTALQSAFRSLMKTESLMTSWNLINFSPLTMFAFITLGVTYFFTSYYLNNGQTYGMKLMKCRINMKEHNLQDSFQWALKSCLVFATMGWISQRYSSSIVAHDHLWRELVAQKEVLSPDVRTLTATEEKEVFIQAA